MIHTRASGDARSVSALCYLGQCFIRGLRPDLEIRVEEKDTFREVIDDSIDIER